MGRSNIKQVAEKRVAEITRFISTLLMCADEIRQSNLVFTFFHPLLRDQQDDHSKKLKDNTVHVHGKLSGQIKLAFQFSKDAFTVMVHHVRGLPRLSNGQEPSTYVKIYLRPDDNKETKRKTKVVKRNCHPSFMEMVSLLSNTQHLTNIRFSVGLSAAKRQNPRQETAGDGLELRRVAGERIHGWCRA